MSGFRVFSSSLSTAFRPSSSRCSDRRSDREMESKKRKRKGFHEPSTKLGFGENEEEGSSVGEVKVRMLSIGGIAGLLRLS